MAMKARVTNAGPRPGGFSSATGNMAPPAASASCTRRARRASALGYVGVSVARTRLEPRLRGRRVDHPRLRLLRPDPLAVRRPGRVVADRNAVAFLPAP